VEINSFVHIEAEVMDLSSTVLQNSIWAITRAINGGFGYTHVLPDGFLLKAIVFTVCEHDYMNIHVLVTALNSIAIVLVLPLEHFYYSIAIYTLMQYVNGIELINYNTIHVPYHSTILQQTLAIVFLSRLYPSFSDDVVGLWCRDSLMSLALVHT
jgi:hypothetical protein